MVATISLNFLIINLPNFVQFKQYQGKSWPRCTRRYFVKSKIFQLYTCGGQSWPWQIQDFSLKAKAKTKTLSFKAKATCKAKTFMSCPQEYGPKPGLEDNNLRFWGMASGLGDMGTCLHFVIIAN